MPTFAVRIEVDGPFRDEADGKWFDGAYSDRLVVASDAESAEKAATEALCSEPQFCRLRPPGGIGVPLAKVDKVRKVSWYERFFGNGALVFYRQSAGASR